MNLPMAEKRFFKCFLLWLKFLRTVSRGRKPKMVTEYVIPTVRGAVSSVRDSDFSEWGS